MSFGGGSSKQTTQSQANIPWELSPLIQGSAGAVGDLQSSLPLSNFIGPNPQEIAPLTGTQQGLIDQITGLSGGYTFPEYGALGALGQVQQNPLGFDVAATPEGTFTSPEMTALNALTTQLNAPIGTQTQELMTRLGDIIGPQVRNMQAIQGTLHGGAADEAIANAMANSAIPFIELEANLRQQAIPQIAGLGETAAGRYRGDVQQGIMNLMSTVGPLAGLGGVGAERYRSDLGMALEAAGMPRDVANQQAEAAYNDFLRLYQLAQQTTLGPIMELGPSIIGTTQTTSSSGGK